MASVVTVKDIALRAAVSIGTVSRVFNNHQNVTTEVRERVLQAAKELGYTGQAGQRTNTRADSAPFREIGFLFSPVNEGTIAAANPFWSQILAGVEREASENHLKLSYRAIGDLRRTPERLQAAVADMRLDGVLLVGPIERRTIEVVQATKLPMVLVAHYEPGIAVEAVLEDSYEGMRRLVDYLLEQGHREIAFIGGPPDRTNPRLNALYPLERRYEAYRTALLGVGVTPDDAWYASSDLTPEGGHRACRTLIESGKPFSALICANDSSALGAAKALHEVGRRIPQDISLVGFGGYLDAAAQMSSPLTTMHFDNVMMGRIAVQRLRACAADLTMPTLTTLLNGTILVRDSVRRLDSK
jgi:LacI family transcriptional regulator